MRRTGKDIYEGAGGREEGIVTKHHRSETYLRLGTASAGPQPMQPRTAQPSEHAVAAHGETSECEIKKATAAMPAQTTQIPPGAVAPKIGTREPHPMDAVHQEGEKSHVVLSFSTFVTQFPIRAFGRSRPAADATREVVERWLLDGLM
jgi:hypothetical protein